MPRLFSLKNLLFLLLLLSLASGLFYLNKRTKDKKEVLSEKVQASHWLLLKRKSNLEFLYYGIPGNEESSKLIRTFTVKVGIPGESPTPLPKLVGKEYWLITDKVDASENLETAPYFLTLNVPVGEEEPYGPTPYLECNGQCNWKLPGYFGLHGVNGDESRLSSQNPGSSGCVRHKDEDITYLYNLLDPKKEEIRYYIKDV